MVLVQSDKNTETGELKTAVRSIPSQVIMPKDLPVAERLIAKAATLLEVGPASRPAVHPRPANAGRLWQDLPEDTQVKYGAIVDCLDNDTVTGHLTHDHVAATLEAVRNGLFHLGELTGQPLSGMVQRSPWPPES